MILSLVAGAILLRGSLSTADAAASEGAGPVTYSQVQPILQSQCANCHNPKGGAPFNLQTYEDAKQWGGQILDVTQSRYMPPWLPAQNRGDFADSRRLSDGDLATIRGWIGAGMPPANGAVAPTPQEPEWALGRPDSVVTLSEAVELPGSGPDLFEVLIAPVTASASGAHRLRAIQIRPSDPQAVRSVWISIDEDGTHHAAHEGQQAIESVEPLPDARSGTQGLIFWSPGTRTIMPRSGERWEVKPGSSLLLGTHLKTTGRKLALQFEIGLYYAAPASGEGEAAVLALKHQGALNLPAGHASQEISDSYVLPQAASVTAVYPRAHFLARTFDAYATTPAGKQVWLLSIPKWDLDWLEVYAFRRPVLLPKGSVVHWTVSYDNSAENPHNPSDPPVDVHEGTGPKDETDALYLEVLPPVGMHAAAWRRAMLPAVSH